MGSCTSSDKRKGGYVHFARLLQLFDCSWVWLFALWVSLFEMYFIAVAPDEEQGDRVVGRNCRAHDAALGELDVVDRMREKLRVLFMTGTLGPVIRMRGFGSLTLRERPELKIAVVCSWLW
jgi:hypothetical protein